MADLGAFIQQKIDDFKSAVNGAATGAEDAVTSGIQNVKNYFNPESLSGGPNYWTSPEGQRLASYQQAAQNLAAAPFHFAEDTNQNIQQAVPGPAGKVAGTAAQIGLGIPQGVMNVPQQIARAGTDIGTDVRTGKIFQPRTAIGDIAEAALPVATIATMGGAGEVAQQGLKEAAVQGAKIGGGFGLLSGFAGNKEVTDPGQYAGNLALNTGAGAMVGGALGAVGSALQKIFSATPDSIANDSAPKMVANQAEKSLTPSTVNQYGKDLFTPESKQQLGNIVSQADKDKPGLDTAFGGIANQTGSQFESRLKDPLTMFQKIILKRSQGREYGAGDLNDVYGGRITITSPQQASAIGSQVDALQSNGVIKIVSAEPVQKDTYSAFHIDFETPSGTRGELQIMTPQQQAESLVNHGIRSEYGETPPASVEAVKNKNADAVTSLPDQQAQQVADTLTARNKANPEESSKPMSVDPNGPLPWETGKEKQPTSYDTLGERVPSYGLAPEPGTPEAEALNNVKQPGQPALDPKYVAEQARLARSGVVSTIQFQARTLAAQFEQVLKTPQDNLNIRLAIEDPGNLQKYASKSSNPQAFIQLAKRYSNFTDFIFSQFKDKNLQMNYVEDYFTHIWDLSTPEARQTYNDLIANIRNQRSGFTRERFVETIQEGLDAGLKLKNTNASNDVLQYSNSMSNQLGAAAFNQKINELRPGGAIEGSGAYNYQGRPFLQSNVPGNQGTFLDPELQRQMGRYNPSAFADNPIIAGKDVQVGDHTIHVPGVDQINQLLKQSKLGFGGFHALNTTLRMVVNDPLSVVPAVQNMFDLSARNRFNQAAIDDGVIAFGAKHGVTFDASSDVLPQNANLMDVMKSMNPIGRLNNAIFGGMVNTYKINLTRAMMRLFPDAETDATQAAGAQAYAKQINDLMGGLNYEAMGRNKTLQQAFRLIGLAPDFSEGTLHQLFTAVNPLGYANDVTRPAALFALKNVIGQVALYAGIAEIGRKLTTGSFSKDFQSFVDNSIVNPNIPLPDNATFNNPRSGKTQSAFLPKSEFNTMLGLAKDPAHFLQARGSAVVAAGGSLLSGKDYYGNSLVNPWDNTPDTPVNRLKALVPGQLPIPVQQGEKLVQGAQTPAVTGLNILGTRVGNNPNDPQTIAATKYFSDLDSVSKSLNPNDQKIFMGQIHPTTKDPNGNPVVDKNVLTTVSKYETMLSNPDIMAAEQQLQQQQPSHDPLWDLPTAQLRAYMQAQVISKNNPISGFGSNNPQSQTVKALYATLPADFFTNRNTWYDSLPQTGAITSGPQAPQMPPAVSQFWNSYAKLPYGTGARTAALNSPLGVAALAFYQQQQQYTNAQRADMGLPLLTASSGSGSGGSGSKSTYRSRMAKQYGNFGFVGGTMIPRPRIPKAVYSKGRLNYKTPKVAKAKTTATPKLSAKLKKSPTLKGIAGTPKAPKLVAKKQPKKMVA